MRTVNQYMASVKRAKGCPADLEYQSSVWGYPQEDQCCIDVWRDSWPHEAARLPAGYICVPTKRGSTGKMFVRENSPTPKQLVAEILSMYKS